MSVQFDLRGFSHLNWYCEDSLDFLSLISMGIFRDLSFRLALFSRALSFGTFFLW